MSKPSLLDSTTKQPTDKPTNERAESPNFPGKWLGKLLGWYVAMMPANLSLRLWLKAVGTKASQIVAILLPKEAASHKSLQFCIQSASRSFYVGMGRAICKARPLQSQNSHPAVVSRLKPDKCPEWSLDKGQASHRPWNMRFNLFSCTCGTCKSD